MKQGSVFARFFRYTVFIAVICLNTANANVRKGCGEALAPEVAVTVGSVALGATVTSFRAKYLAIAASANRSGDGRAPLRNYSRSHIVKWQLGLDIRDPLVEKINSIADAVLSSNEFDLRSLNRLSYIYAELHNRRLQPETLGSSFPLFGGGKDLLHLEDESLISYLLGRDSNLYFRHRDFQLENVMLRYTGRWEFIPTFANLGFESILWGISRGIFFVGQSRGFVPVDNLVMGPTRFSLHDFDHFLSIDRTFKADSAETTSRFWDQIEADINSIAANRSEQKLMYGILFILIHENSDLGMPGDINKVGQFDVSRMLKRFSDKNDLGLSFDVFPSRSDLRLASAKLVEAVHRQLPLWAFRIF